MCLPDQRNVLDNTCFNEVSLLFTGYHKMYIPGTCFPLVTWSDKCRLLMRQHFYRNFLTEKNDSLCM